MLFFESSTTSGFCNLSSSFLEDIPESHGDGGSVSLNLNGPQRLIYLNICLSAGGGLFGKEKEVLALLKEVCHWWQTWSFQNPMPFPAVTQ